MSDDRIGEPADGARSSVLALALADWVRNELRPNTPRARELAEQMLRVLDLMSSRTSCSRGQGACKRPRR